MKTAFIKKSYEEVVAMPRASHKKPIKPNPNILFIYSFSFMPLILKPWFWINCLTIFSDFNI